MKEIICNLSNPMQLEYKGYVLDEDNKEVLENFTANMESIAKIISNKYNTYSADEIILIGNPNYLEQLKRNILEESIDKYSEAPTIRIQ